MCAGPADVGERCDPVLGCLGGLQCDYEKNVCFVPRAFGEACTAPFQCASSMCDVTCRRLPREGEPCGNGCDTNLRCVDRTCRKKAAVGEPCRENSNDCESYAKCGGNGACVRDESPRCE